VWGTGVGIQGWGWRILKAFLSSSYDRRKCPVSLSESGRRCFKGSITFRITSLNIMTFIIATPSIKKLSIMSLNITTLNIMTLSIMILRMTLGIKTLRIMTLTITILSMTRLSIMIFSNSA
jgi:hypothetical protein